uniref:Pentacotripeptide-repeat region of PRORP domain-containing protein n=1 Tax=Salix viminalis TaxID=40686 RepID=A0A6N2LYE3_SALVM
MELFVLNQKHSLAIPRTHERCSFITSLLNPASKFSFRCLQTIETSQNPYKEPFSSASNLPDSLLVEKIVFNLKHGNVNSLLSYQLRLNPSVIVDVLCRCNGDLQLGQRFIDSLVLKGTNFKHSSVSLSAMIHVFVRSRRLSDAQTLILRMIRRSGVSRVEVVEALVSSTCGNCGTNNLVFDLLIRTYVQTRKLREGTEAYFVSINACNSLLGGLVKIGWVEMAWEVHREVVKSGIELNVYTLNIMVNALCKDGKFGDVKSFFK